MTDRNKLLKKITFYFIIIAILLNFLAISINKYFFYDDFKKLFLIILKRVSIIKKVF